MNSMPDSQENSTPDQIKISLSVWDYVNLYFLRDAPTLTKEQNIELFQQLKNVGMAETLAIYVNSSISALILYLMMWASSDNIEHMYWLLNFFPITIVPLIVMVLLNTAKKVREPTYREFVVSQLFVLPCGILGWAWIAFFLVPQFGTSPLMCLAIITAASVYTIIWFKTLPIGTLLWTIAFCWILVRIFWGYDVYFVDPDPVFYLGKKDLTSAFLAVIFVFGVNGLAIYLFLAEIHTQLNKITLAHIQSLNQLLVNTFEKNSKDFLWQADNKGEITYASSQLQQLLNSIKGHETQADPNILLDNDNQFGATLRWHIRSKDSFEMVLAKMPIEHVMEYWAITGDPLMDEQNVQVGFSGFGTNVTAVQQAENRKSQVDNYRSMTRMASMIGHDFNNYLATIFGCMDLIKLKIDDKKQIERHLALASEALKDAERMTTQLLDLGDREVENIQQLNLSEVLEKVTEETKAVYPSGLEIVQDIPKDVVLYADATQLSRSARNILENSAFAVNSKGVVKIEVEILKSNSLALNAMKVIKPVKSGQDYLVLRFTDNGPGFPRDGIDKIFEPFMTTKAKKGGKGLGLAMVESFCLQLQGFAIAKNGIKKGAVIEMVLPIRSPIN